MNAKILQIQGTGDKIAYNPTIPFEDRGTTCIGVRVESLDSELDSKIYFAHKLRENIWEIDDSLPFLHLQDPVYMKIGDESYIAGVNVQGSVNGAFRNQEFYRGDSIKNLEHFASGPPGMKDIRLVDLGNRIGVFTRPQGEIGGLGKIGYLEIGRINELAKLTENDWYSAQLIDGLFEEGTWGGVNQAIVLSNREIGVIGHKAHKEMSENDWIKHYHAISFRFDTKSKSINKLRKIATRADFPSSPAKRSPELSDIIFPAGIDRKLYLYCGLSDYSSGVKKMKHLF